MAKVPVGASEIKDYALVYGSASDIRRQAFECLDGDQRSPVESDTGIRQGLDYI
jgi:hypothetical protein